MLSAFSMSVLSENTKEILRRILARCGFRPSSISIVTGAPRSGTTALCDWLNLQPGMVSLPETKHLIACHYYIENVKRFNRLWEHHPFLFHSLQKQLIGFHYRYRSLYARHLILKEPLEPIAFPDKSYRAFLSNLELFIPGAKVILLIRDPVATIWSMINRKWGTSLRSPQLKSFTVDEHLETWKTCADLILEVNNRQNVFVCSYSRLIEDPTTVSHKLGDFLNFNVKFPFTPKETKTIEFPEAIRNKIMSETSEQMKKLQGII